MDDNTGGMEIRLYATLRQLAGANSITLDVGSAQTVGDVLRALAAAQPRLAPVFWAPDGTLARHLAVMLGGRDVRHLSGVDTPVGDAEHLDIFPPVAGGHDAVPARSAANGCAG